MHRRNYTHVADILYYHETSHYTGLKEAESSRKCVCHGEKEQDWLKTTGREEDNSETFMLKEKKNCFNSIYNHTEHMLCTSLQKCCLRLNSDQARILVNISLVVKDTECPKMMWLEWCNLLNNGILNNSLKCWYKCTQCLGYRFYKLWLRIRKRLCFGLSWTVVSG